MTGCVALQQFWFGGHRICIKTFCFLHNIGEGKFTSIKSSWLENGLRPRQRQHTTPHNVTSSSDVQQVVRFILNYAEDNAILLPGRIPGYKCDDMQLLPSSVTKREVWELYHETAASRESSLAVCYSLFCRFWRQLTPQVVVAKPMSDLCWTCQKNSTLIMRAHNTPVEEKTEVNVINLPFTYIFSTTFTSWCTTHLILHSRCIINPLQPGPIYFLTSRKAAIFGVCCEAIPRQVNFVIDEASDTGKGANTVVSLLDYYFSHHGLGEATASLHADNCSGQNKNNTMVQYLMWRVLTGLHQTISLHFRITGHTKLPVSASSIGSSARRPSAHWTTWLV